MRSLAATISFYSADIDSAGANWTVALAAAQAKKKVTVTVESGKVKGFQVVRESTHTAGGKK